MNTKCQSSRIANFLSPPRERFCAVLSPYQNLPEGTWEYLSTAAATAQTTAPYALHYRSPESFSLSIVPSGGGAVSIYIIYLSINEFLCLLKSGDTEKIIMHAPHNGDCAGTGTAWNCIQWDDAEREH
jgi:hypothetical protein